MERQYKDSGIEWIGRIPKGWEVVPFRSYVNERSEKNKGEKTHELLALSFALGVTLYKDKVFNMDRVKDNYEDYQLVYENDLVLSPNDIIKGSVFVSKYSGCISPMYFVFSARNVKTHYLPYLSYLLRTREAGKKFFFIARGLIGSLLDNGKYVTRRMTVSKQDLLKFKVLLPSLVEQHKIVEYLDKKCEEIDELIALQEKMIAQLTEYKQAVITEAVTKGLDPNAKLVPSGIEWIGDVPEGWKVCRFKSYISLVKEKVDDQCLPKINLENIESFSGKFIETDSKYDGEGCLFEPGDVLFGKLRPYLAKVFVPDYRGQAIGDFYVFRPSTKVETNYLKYIILSDTFISNVNSSTYGTKMPRANWDYISTVYIAIPSKDEQYSIASYLDTKCSEIDTLITLKRQKIESLNAYKKSVIYEAVTGKAIIE